MSSDWSDIEQRGHAPAIHALRSSHRLIGLSQMIESSQVSHRCSLLVLCFGSRLQCHLPRAGAVIPAPRR